MNCCNVRMKSMRQLYKGLMSRNWGERLKAYERLMEEVQRLGVRFRDSRLISSHSQEFKLLLGQLVSIHFKKYRVKTIKEFGRRMMKLYSCFVKPLYRMPARICSQWLMDIYDDDDHVAQHEIRQYYARLRPGVSVLESICGCYYAMMHRVAERTTAVLATRSIQKARETRAYYGPRVSEDLLMA